MDFTRGPDGEVLQTFQRASSDITPEHGQRPQSNNPQVLFTLHPDPHLSAYNLHLVRHLRLVPQISILPTILCRSCTAKRPSPSGRRLREHTSTHAKTLQSCTGRSTQTVPWRSNWPTRPSATSIICINISHNIPASPGRDRS